MNVEAFILAGGRSSRYGTDKALMKLDGRSVVEMIAAAIHEALPDSKIRLVASGDAQLLSWPFLLPTIFDLYPGHGPWSGLQAALAYAESEWIFVAPCDHPFISADLMNMLATKLLDGVDAVVPTQEDGRPQPLCAFYRRDVCLAVAEGVVTANRIAPPLRAMAEHVCTVTVGFEEIRELDGSDRFFTNINTVLEHQNIEPSATRGESGYN
jgi:molybdopterin-guanine dinucleotide biosynthesis protein A